MRKPNLTGNEFTAELGLDLNLSTLSLLSQRYEEASS